ncbi:MAG: hypothetical protein ACJAZO_001312 [Myxococcota bacterium]
MAIATVLFVDSLRAQRLHTTHSVTRWAGYRLCTPRTAPPSHRAAKQRRFAQHQNFARPVFSQSSQVGTRTTSPDVRAFRTRTKTTKRWANKPRLVSCTRHPFAFTLAGSLMFTACGIRSPSQTTPIEPPIDRKSSIHGSWVYAEDPTGELTPDSVYVAGIVSCPIGQ